MRDSLLPFAPPAIGNEEIAEVVAALRSAWITTGPRTRLFEQRFAEFTGASAALALNSGTAALHVALAALGVGRGSVVITTAMTFCSGVHVIEQMGARPLLVDVDPETLNIDPAQVERAARTLRPLERLGAIMPVHLYGHPCDHASLLETARRYNCAIVEDAAHAFPSCYRDKMIGATVDADIPVLTAFSFYATKNMTTGEGGMLTGPPDLISEARGWSLHGISHDAWSREESRDETREPPFGETGGEASGETPERGQRSAPWFYEVTRPGFKYNMTDIQAAIGLAQLSKIADFRARRTEIAAHYNSAFGALDELQIPAHRSGIEHAWHIYALRLNLDKLRISRNEFIEELRRRNIAASVHFIPVHLHPYYRDTYNYRPDDFPIAHGEYKRLVSLPIYPTMEDQDIDDVIEAVTAIATEYRKAVHLATAKA